jgi:UDP-N-acetylglucosamine--N-acetylmuramyl-(pentapeptide) pyrophosphoryl-undecaprenol N-acetylglucosamine transferase
MMPSIVFTGGGTAGHVTPNIALIESLIQKNWQIHYIGSPKGVEKSMIEKMGIPYYAVLSGKLRRYFSWKNFLDPIKVLFGIVQAYFRLRQLKPDIVFSKGGFVALPVVVGAYLNGIPIIAHESDISPGLANRLSFPFVSKICVTFDAAKQHFKHQEKIAVTGTPIRNSLFQGCKKNGLTLCSFSTEKPCVLVVGGSQGSHDLNTVTRQGLISLLPHFQVIHLCGKHKLSHDLLNMPGYYQLEYADEELPDLLAASDVVVSRSGANALYELLALAKPHVLIPLSLKASRGDQIQNARYFEKLGISTVLDDDTLSTDQLIKAINEVYEKRDELTTNMHALSIASATDTIVDLLEGDIKHTPPRMTRPI